MTVKAVSDKDFKDCCVADFRAREGEIASTPSLAGASRGYTNRETCQRDRLQHSELLCGLRV
jgi:hypothetical protein